MITLIYAICIVVAFFGITVLCVLWSDSKQAIRMGRWARERRYRNEWAVGEERE